jgi:hypothetical protein
MPDGILGFNAKAQGRKDIQIVIPFLSVAEMFDLCIESHPWRLSVYTFRR